MLYCTEKEHKTSPRQEVRQPMANNPTQLTIHLLGSPQAYIAGEPLALHNHKARALLYYLAATERSHTRDHLATLLWSESPDSNARHSLRSSLYHIRQVLHVRGAERALAAEGDLIYLKLNHYTCDVISFRQLLKEGQENALSEAVSLYRGPLLQGFILSDVPLFEEWLRYEACQLDQAYLATLQQLATWAEQRQAWNQAITYLRYIVQHDPLSEEAQQRLISLYIHSGDIGQALRQYHQFETELRQELGLTPSPATQALISFVDRDTKRLLSIGQETSKDAAIDVLLQAENNSGQSHLLDELISTLNANAQTAAFLHHLHDLLAPTASIHEKLRLTLALGQVHQSLGQLEEATSWHRRHLELARQASDLPAQSVAHFELGELALVANDYQAAASAAKTGLAIPIPVAHPQYSALSGRGHWLLGAALAMEGSDLPSAENHLQQAVAAHRLTGNMRNLCGTLFELGNVAAQRGELAKALERYQEAARIAETVHEHYFLALAHNNFAYHSILLGRPSAAQQALAKGITLAETYEMFGALLHLNSTEGEIHLYLGEWAAASAAFQRGLTLAQELCNVERQAGYKAGLALVARGQHDLEAATGLLTEALMLISGRGYWHMHTRIQLWLAETLLLLDHFSEAEPLLNTALQTAQAHGRMLLLMQCQRLQARLLSIHNKWHTATALFAKTLACASNLNLPLEVARTQAAWGESLLHYARGPHDGDALLTEARKIFAVHDARAELESIFLQVQVPH
jgi:DNA-binding SARP family transcriptional activator